MRRVERVVEIDAPVERVFDLFSDFEGFPRWMQHVREVRRTGRRYTRWRADTPLGMDVEWEAETTRFEPDRRIAWRSVRGDVETDGEVVFSEIDPGTTRMRVVLGYAPPAGRLGDAFARLLGRDPAAELGADLRRFKHLAEGGRGDARRTDDERPRREPVRERREPTRERPRRHEARFADAPRPREYAPPRSDEHYYREVLGMRGREERARHYDERGRRYDERARPYRDERARYEYERDERVQDEGARVRRYREDAERGRERGFEEALRAARHSQLESMRRYREGGRPTPAWQRMLEAERAARREERRRDERRAHDAEQVIEERIIERRRRGPVEDVRRADVEDVRRADVEDVRRADEAERPYRPRYALTPRERERELAERGWDTEAKERVLRRSVDRLLDEGPSREWRRWERNSDE